MGSPQGAVKRYSSNLPLDPLLQRFRLELRQLALMWLHAAIAWC
jgi:hypothetical protein